MSIKKDMIAPAETEAKTKTKSTVEYTTSPVISVADGITHNCGECENIKTVRFGVTEAGAVIIPCIDRSDFPGGHRFYCPFCKRYHIHGTSEGHRSPHCFKSESPLLGRDYYIRHMTPSEEAIYKSMSPKNKFRIEGLTDRAETGDREDFINEHRPLCVQDVLEGMQDDVFDFELVCLKSRLDRGTITKEYYNFMTEGMTIGEMCERGFITCQTRDELNDEAREAWVDEQENKWLDMCADGGV